MFSEEIISTDAFMDMPKSSQLLYFHLGMNADDDGFIGSPKVVMRAIGAGDDDYKILLSKKFLLVFPSGICVVKHWRINNFVRKDIYKISKYSKERGSLMVRKNGAYTLNNDADNPLSLPLPDEHFTVENIFKNKDIPTLTKRQRVVNLDKVSIGKDSIDKISKEEYSLEFEKFWSIYPEKKGKGKAYQIWQKIKIDRDQIIKVLVAQVEAKQFKEDYTPHPATWLNQKRWEDEIKVKEIKSNQTHRI